VIGNELFKLEQELQLGDGKEPSIFSSHSTWEHNDDLCPFKILENQEVQMSQELFLGEKSALPYSRDQRGNH